MGIGVPLALLGALLVAVPLWLHRVRKKQLRDQPLPTLRLLLSAAEKRRRTLHFADRSLLLTRAAMIALLALALSQPFVSRLVSYATERPIALAIVIDDSLSMSRKSRRFGTLFERAQSRARAVLGELSPESEATLVLGGNRPRVPAPRTRDLGLVQAAVLDAEHSGARGTALADAVAVASRELSGSKLSMREILVLTDCAAHAAASRLESGVGLRVECMPVREGEHNAFIESARIAPDPDSHGMRTLAVAIGGQRGNEKGRIKVLARGEAIGEAPLEDESSGAFELSLPEDKLEGVRTVRVVLELDDAIGADNERELSVEPRSRLSTLLVDGDPAPSQRDDELRFISLALSTSDRTHSATRLTRIDGDGLAGADLDSYDVIVLANLKAPSEAEAARLTAWVERGGGLVMTMGDRVDPFAYRGRLGGLVPAVLRSAAQAQPSLTITVADATTRELLHDGGPGLETGRTTERMLVENPEAPAQTLLSFEDGTPLLIFGPFGAGRVALLTTSIDDDWTDLPLTPGFLPLVQGIVRSMAEIDALLPGPHVAGNVLLARVPRSYEGVTSVTPDGRRNDVSVSDGTLRITDTAIAGVYRTFVTTEGGGDRELPQLAFEVVPDLSESDVTFGGPPKAQATAAAKSIGKPKSIDPWLWLLFGLAAAAEGALRLLSRGRGTAGGKQEQLA